MTAIQQIENWRISPANDFIPMPFIETQADNGEWFSPDCGYVCRHCGNCMGCQRKLMMWDDEDGRGWRIVESEIRCSDSPTGCHVAVEFDEEEEE